MLIDKQVMIQCVRQTWKEVEYFTGWSCDL